MVDEQLARDHGYVTDCDLPLSDPILFWGETASGILARSVAVAHVRRTQVM